MTNLDKLLKALTKPTKIELHQETKQTFTFPIKGLDKQITRGLFFAFAAVFIFFTMVFRFAEGDYLWGIIDFIILMVILYL